MKAKTFAALAAVAGGLSLASGAVFAQSDTEIMLGSDTVQAGSTLKVDSVKATEDGFIAVHAKSGDSAGDVIGYAPVMQGDNANVEITLDKEVQPGDELELMLHTDTGEKGKYEFGMEGSQEDGPAMADGKPVSKTVRVQ